MSRIRTALQVKSCNADGLHLAAPTLYLAVTNGGRGKSWIQFLTINGKRHKIGLGSVNLVSLAEARDQAHENRRAVQAGGDPLAEKRRAVMPTFRQAAVRTIAARQPRWRNGQTAAIWSKVLGKHVYPAVGATPVDKIGREDVLRILTPIWASRPEQARRARRMMRAVFLWAQAHGLIDTNPAGEVIDGALPAQPAVKANLRALPWREVPAALDTVEQSPASLAARLALRFQILTACRGGEIRGAAWAEIDLEGATWTIPGLRMKSNREHRVPLTAPALEILEQARALADGSGLVFPSPRRPGRPLSDMAFTKVLRDTGLADRTTAHGFRSSFRDWAADNGKARDVAEAALAHVVGGTEGSYFRSDVFDRRRLLMDQWAAFLTDTGADVVRLRA
ncbi:MAG: tyrosine-type recombinase/integrase [Gammaproteobacteria bacterium]|nr:tyrosine-type recombinase/integrase [Gammaproteobacteria bacterium]MDE0510434.1 tyrosine-type recombinase/integrase [Gammaproteobacteria bacterium]